jgi:hypothetical protein
MKTAVVTLNVDYNPNATNPSLWDWTDLINQPISHMDTPDFELYYCDVSVESIKDIDAVEQSVPCVNRNNVSSLYCFNYSIQKPDSSYVGEYKIYQRYIVAKDMDTALVEFHRIAPSFSNHKKVIQNVTRIYEAVYGAF